MTLYDPWQHPNATHEQHLTWSAESWRRVHAGEVILPPQPDLALHVDPDPDRPRMSRGAQRAQWRARTYRIDTDGRDNDGKRVETWEHDGRVEVIG